MFFVITAMLGLVGASQKMTASAKRSTLLTNAMAERVDSIRAMPYGSITSTGVPASLRVTYQGIPVLFTHRVVIADADGSDRLRSVYVGGSVTLAGRTYRSQAVVHIRNPNSETGGGTIADPDKPVATWLSPTPVPDSVLFETYVYDAGSATTELRASGHGPTDNITRFEYRVNGVAVRDRLGLTGSDAIFIAPTDFNASADVVTSTGWHTRQEGVVDGFQTVTVTVYDEMGRSSTVSRRFIIDNDPPAAPGVSTGTGTTDVTAYLQFLAAADPANQAATWASDYQYRLVEDTASGPFTGTDTGAPPSSWTERGTGLMPAATGSNAVRISKLGTITLDPVPTSAFRRYWTGIRGASLRGLLGPETGMGTPFISPPAMIRYGASTVSSATTDFTIPVTGSSRTRYIVGVWVTSPQFPINDTTIVPYFKQKDRGSTVWSAETTLTAASITRAQGNYIVRFAYTELGVAKEKLFKVGFKVTPTGWRGGTPVTVWSNPSGYTAIDTNQAVGGVNQIIQPLPWGE